MVSSAICELDEVVANLVAAKPRMAEVDSVSGCTWDSAYAPQALPVPSAPFRSGTVAVAGALA